uniref:SFRICE_041189 n=1 Tax=Spodoptera frugiperda TaxID=7108 RepID=A0A2H1VPI7_SPOFR
MSTKAVHLELASDLSTSSFIAALRRMAARRGTPSHIYSDNGRNFIGANKQIQQEYQELLQLFNKELLAELTDMEIKWHFNAPIWPSAGGLWESAVKSFKHHFRRVVGEQKLTFEEMSTVLAQIEACLNSRPLCPLTEDPESLDYLTPSHFLTGGSVLTLVETERDLRTRWQLTQRIFADIWKRWRSDYLTQLTTRSKWRQSRENINLNDVVILHDDNLPPGKWSMGRVVDLHPGADGFVRVVSLKTKNGILKRPITKISMLPVNETLSNSSENAQDELKTNSEKTNLQRKSKRVRITTLFTSLLFFMAIVTGGHCDFQSTRFRSNQSLYFDKLSNLKIIRDEWKLIIYYDMQPYWEGITALNKYTKSLEQPCKTIRNRMNCDIILLQLVQGFSELEYYNQMLLGQHVNDQRARQRRGLIDGVGYLANSLFGVLDARFADQYRKDIMLLRDNQRHIASYWKNQTSIIEVEYNLLKRTEQTMMKQHKMVSQHIFSIDKALNQLQSETQNMSIVNELTVGAIIASNMLHTLKSLQSTLLDTITDIFHGQFNPHLLTPIQLQDQLSTIASQLPKDVSLLVDNVQMDLKKIYKLLKVKARMLEEYLIFEIRLPLISRDTFEIFKIFSIPQVKGTDMVSIQPISDYVAINLKKDTYFIMTEKTLTSCLILDAYLCHIQTPIYHLNGDLDFCQTEELECETRISPCKDRWFESNTINNYIYFCCNQCSLRIMCEDQVASHQLTGAGLVAIDNGCMIKTQAFTLIAHRQQFSQMKIKSNVYTPLIPPINHIINITIPHMRSMDESISDQDRMDLAELGQQINFLKENAAIAEGISVHDIHHYTLIYIVVGTVGIAGLVYVWRRWRAWSVPNIQIPTLHLPGLFLNSHFALNNL